MLKTCEQNYLKEKRKEKLITSYVRCGKNWESFEEM